MPLILKAAGQRIYMRGGNAQAQLQLYGLQGWSYIKDRAETANLFSFGFPEPCFENGNRYIPGIRDEVFIYRSELDFATDNRWFGGLITNVGDSIINQPNGRFIAGYRFECASFDIMLDKEIRQPQKAGLSWSALLSFLLQTHFASQLSGDYSRIQNDIAAPPIRINNGTIRTLLVAMRQLTGHDSFVDAYKRLNVFQSADIPGSFQVNDTPASGITVWEERPSITHEGRAVYNVVRQPFQSQVDLNGWPGETFTGKGDPKGSGGQLALLRTPADIDATTYLDERFDSLVDASRWQELDDTNTHHADYPHQGYLFAAEGQLQIVGGTGTLGGVALYSQQFFQAIESAYLVQEFQLTNSTGDGYIALFTTGASVSPTDFKAGLRITDGALKALDGTVLVSSLGTTDNYLLWVTITPGGFQYDIQGGAFATKQTIRIETGTTHASDYRIAPVVNRNLQGSINSVRYRRSDRGVVLQINGQQKVVGLEASDTDLPDIDAYLNLDETPALLKFRAAEEISVIASVTSATVLTVASGHGSKFAKGQRLLIGDNIVEEFNGKAGIVASITADTVTLVSPGIAGLAIGQQILVNTTVPAAGDKIVVRYGYARGDEATAYDQRSIDKYGPLPITLDEKDYLKRFDDAQMEAESYLAKYADGILTIQFKSNDKLIPVDPDAMTAIPVSLTQRPDPINKTLILQRVEVTPTGGTGLNYALTLESADPVKPFDDTFKTRNLSIGSDGEIRFTLNLTEETVSDVELLVQRIDSSYITWRNPAKRRWGEFKWKPDDSLPVPGTGGGKPVGLLLVFTTTGSVALPPVNPTGGQPVGLLLAVTQQGFNPPST